MKKNKLSSEFSILAEIYADCFLNTWSAFSHQFVNQETFRTGYFFHEFDNRECKQRCEHCLLSDKSTFLNYFSIEQMLQGETSLGACCIDREGQSKFCVWDVDSVDNRLDHIETALKSLKIESCRVTGRVDPTSGIEIRSGHLWVLFRSKIHASDLEVFRQVVESAAGMHPSDKKCSCGCQSKKDYFPVCEMGKQPARSNVRMPLSANLKVEAGFDPKLHARKQPQLRGWFKEAPHEMLSQLRWLKINRNRLENDPQLLHRIIEERKVFITAYLQTEQEFRNQARQYASTLAKVKTGKAGAFKHTSPRDLIHRYCEQEDLDLTQRGRNLYTACPLCGSVNDGAEDNLMIQIPEAGEVFCCFAGKSDGTHTAKDIYRHLIINYGDKIKEKTNGK